MSNGMIYACILIKYIRLLVKIECRPLLIHTTHRNIIKH